ncbi:MAG: hypothetical protein QXW72_02365 [Conexivisphaerales archaeon]
MTARAADELGLEIWYYPVLWDRSPAATLNYFTRATTVAETIRSSKG